MHETITIGPDKWPNSTEAAHIIGRSQRAVQKLAAEGLIKWKLAGRKSHPNARLYDPQDLQRLITNASLKAEPEAVAVRSSKPSQENRALDVVSVVGNQAIGYKGAIEAMAVQSTRQIEILVGHLDRQLSQFERRFEGFITLMLDRQKAEADANRERLKAEREDARERWDIQRQDKQERQKARAAHNGKA